MVLQAAKAWTCWATRKRGVYVSAVKAMVPEKVCRIIDDAIQMHGATGISQWTPLADMYAHSAHCVLPTDRMRCTTWWWGETKFVDTTSGSSLADMEPNRLVRVLDSHVHFFDATRSGGIEWPANDSPIYGVVLPANRASLAVGS